MSQKEITFKVDKSEIEDVETHLMSFGISITGNAFSDYYVAYDDDKNAAVFHLFLHERYVNDLKEHLIAAPFRTVCSVFQSKDAAEFRTYYTQALEPFWLTGNLLVDPFIGTGKEIQVIKIKPGKAFGIGDHPTTRMAARLLEKYLSKGKNVIDIGCGTGILSIIASKLGAKDIYSYDVDPSAIEEAKENAENNGITGCLSFICQDYLKSSNSFKFDLLVSNIYAEILVEVVEKALNSRTENPCHPLAFILTGILEEKWAGFNTCMENFGLSLVEKMQDAPWSAGVWMI